VALLSTTGGKKGMWESVTSPPFTQSYYSYLIERRIQ
jgi:hypothetical protein